MFRGFSWVLPINKRFRYKCHRFLIRPLIAIALLTVLNQGLSLAFAATYTTTGTLTSSNLLSGIGVSSIDAFGYNLNSLPAGTTAQVQFSNDNSTWYSSAGVQDAWDTLSQGDFTLEIDAISLATLGWSDNIFYYKIQMDTSDTSATATLTEIVLYYAPGASAETLDPTYVKPTSATANGEIDAITGGNATERGFQYGLTETATWATSETGDFGAEEYSLEITGLTPNTKYYIRAFATNPEGTTYGTWVNFTTSEYAATGTLTSDNILDGETVEVITEFEYSMSAMPSGASATIQFSEDGTNWYNSTGILNGTDELYALKENSDRNKINLCELRWREPNFYYKVQFTPSASGDTPILDSINVTYDDENYTCGPIAHWKLDEGQGVSAYNSSASEDRQDAGASSAHTGTISGATWQEETLCIDGGCLGFDGTNDSVAIAGTVRDVFGISFWMRPATTTEEVLKLASGVYVSVASGVVSATGFSNPTIRVNGDLNGLVEANAWNFVAITGDAGISANAMTLGVGGAGGTTYFDGFLDEVRLYAYERSATQLLNDYAVGSASAGANAVLGASLGYGSGYNLSEGLVGYWKMDESGWTGAAGEVRDSSGAGNHGTAYGGATTGAGKYGKAGSFDGVDDYVSVPLSLGDTHTISLWVRQDAFLSNPNPFAKILVGTGNNRCDIYTSSGSIQYYGGGEIMSCTLPLLSIQHITIVIVGNNGYLYRNGVLEDTSTDLELLCLALKIGGGASSRWFNGLIDEVRIYNRALSAEEVRALYEYAPSPISHLKLDEGTGATAQDSSGNDNSGTLQGTPLWVPGKYGKGVDLGGSDFVVVGEF